MDCKTVEKRLLEYLEDTIDSIHRNQIASHIQECPHCQEEQATWVHLISRLKQVDLPDPGEPFWRNLTLSVTRTIQQDGDHAQLPTLSERFFSFAFPSFRWAMACAAAVLVVVGVSFFMQPRSIQRPLPMTLSLEETAWLAASSDDEGVEVLLNLLDDQEEEDVMDLMIESEV